MGQQRWRYGVKTFRSSDAVLTRLRAELEKLKPGDVTDWMDLVRTARHPHILWSIDYILGGAILEEVNHLIKKSEILLYGNTESLVLKEGYSADIYQEVAFHTVRAHLRAEDGQFSTCIKIFEELLETYYDNLATVRKSNLLMHACLCFLCCKKWDESFHSLQRHWNLLKYATPQERDSLGLWDNEILLRGIYWFFIKHCMDFRNFYSSKMELPSSQFLWKHKKIGFLHLLEHDNSWAVSFCSLALYKHARTLMPSLPEYTIKSTTPVNSMHVEEDSVRLAHCDKQEDKYLARFRSLLLRDWDVGNLQDSIHLTEVKDSLFSYMHFFRNRTKEQNMAAALIMFANDCAECEILETSESIIDVGCGTILHDLGLRELPGKYVGVDVSEHVISLLKHSNLCYEHSDINTYLDRASDVFDLCWCCGTLPEMTESEIERFLRLASRKTNRLATVIELNDDQQEIAEIGEVIGEVIQACAEKKGLDIPPKIINLHRTIWSEDIWKQRIEEFFDIKTHTEGDLLYVYGVSKHANNSVTSSI